MLDNIDNLLVSFEKEKVSFRLRESVIRKFVASNHKNEKGWQALIHILHTNQNWRELTRLARQMHTIFPTNINAILAIAMGLANLLKLEESLAFIADQTHVIKHSEPLMRFAAELQIFIDPKAALNTFDLLTASDPENILALRGQKSAKSLINSRSSAEVVFLQMSSWHFTIQEEIFDLLTEQHIGCVMTSEFWLINALKPKIIVLSDTPMELIHKIRCTLPDTLIVNTRHGLGDKNYAYYASGIVDYVCASSEHVAKAQILSGCLDPDSVWITGFPQMDPLFKMFSQHGTSPTKSTRNILFAPTFTKGMNAGELIGENPVRMLRGHHQEWHVTVRPHPHMRQSHPRLLQQWANSIAGEDNAVLDMNFDKHPAEIIFQSDILVSDFSSVALQYLALDRPIVCFVQEEKASQSPYFDPNAYEVKLGEAALKVCNASELANAVETSLNGKQSSSIVSRRQALAHELFGKLRDGNAAKRVTNNIMNILIHQNEKNLH